MPEHLHYRYSRGKMDRPYYGEGERGSLSAPPLPRLSRMVFPWRFLRYAYDEIPLFNPRILNRIAYKRVRLSIQPLKSSTEEGNFL